MDERREMRLMRLRGASLKEIALRFDCGITFAAMRTLPRHEVKELCAELAEEKARVSRFSKHLDDSGSK